MQPDTGIQATMATIDLDGLSLDELKSLKKDVDKAIESYEKRRRQDALAAAEAAAREKGFSLMELMDAAPKKAKSGSPVPAKYCHPENPAITWSGRGRQPTWIKQALDAGRSLDEFLIAKS